MLANPLDIFKKQIDILKAKFQGDASDWQLICQYLLMSLIDVDSVRESVVSKKKRNRLYLGFNVRMAAILKIGRWLKYTPGESLTMKTRS